jgi:hypothetical protein
VSVLVSVVVDADHSDRATRPVCEFVAQSESPWENAVAAGGDLAETVNR